MREHGRSEEAKEQVEVERLVTGQESQDFPFVIGRFKLQVRPVFKVNSDRGLMQSLRSAPNAEPRAVASGCYGQR